MSRMRRLCLACLLSAACQGADSDAVLRHVEQLCERQDVREEYLDFYWDDLRSHQPELWAEALATCRRTCPDAVNCGPVLSVASWYQQPAAVSDP